MMLICVSLAFLVVMINYSCVFQFHVPFLTSLFEYFDLEREKER